MENRIYNIGDYPFIWNVHVIMLQRKVNYIIETGSSYESQESLSSTPVKREKSATSSTKSLGLNEWSLLTN